MSQSWPPPPTTRKTPPWRPLKEDAPYEHSFEHAAPTSETMPPPGPAPTVNYKSTPRGTVAPWIVEIASKFEVDAAGFVSSLPAGTIEARVAVGAIKSIAGELSFTSERDTMPESGLGLSESERETIGRILVLAGLALRG